MSKRKNKVSQKQLNAIRANYARIANQEKTTLPKKSTHISAPYPHFRYYKKNKHPALIVGEQEIDEYRFRKVMHAEKDGNRTNEKVEPNPNPKDTEPMYIGKRIRHDKKEFFEDKPLPWKYPD